MPRNEVLPEPIQFGKYQLLEKIAEGRMGTVFKAKRGGVEGFEKVLVVKRLFPHLSKSESFVNAFVDEAKLTVSLSHANIVQVMDLGQTDGAYFMAMEHVAGLDLGTVRRLLAAAARPVPLDIIVFAVSEVAKGLDYAHRRKDYNFASLNIVHRDLSPSNILISYEGEIKITDFGISRALEVAGVVDADPRRRHLYASPEQARGEELSSRSDIFSLGLILYELISGVHPYEDSDPAVVERRARGGEITPIKQVAELPRALEQIVTSSLVSDPAGRVDSAGTLYEELISYLFASGQKADNRSLSRFMEEVRALEDEFPDAARSVSPTTTPLDMDDVEEIDLEDIEEIIEAPDLWRLGGGRVTPGRETAGSSPAAVAPITPRDVTGPSRFDPVPQPDAIPGRLSEIADGLRGGHGAAVALTGGLGTAGEYVPDRLPARLQARGLVQVLGVHLSADDISVPYRLASVLVRYAAALPVAAAFDVDSAGSVNDRSSGAAVAQLAGCGFDGEEQLMAMQLAGIVERLPRGFHAKRELTMSLVGKIVASLTVNAPLVFVLDGVDGLGPMSADLLSFLAQLTAQYPLLLVVATNSSEELSNLLAMGNNASYFETVDAGGRREDEGSTAQWMTPDSHAGDIMRVLALADRPVSIPVIERLLAVGESKLDQAVTTLADQSAVRLVAPEHLRLADNAMRAAVVDSMMIGDRARVASVATRMLAASRSGGRASLATPAHVRLLCWLGRRDDAVRLAVDHGKYLCEEGWSENAVEGYRVVESLMQRIGVLSPQNRVDLRLASARISLDLMLPRRAQQSLEGVRALAVKSCDDMRSGRALVMEAQIAFLDGDVKRAWDALDRAEEVADAVGDYGLARAVAYQKARVLARHGDLLLAEGQLGRWFGAADGWTVDPVEHGQVLALQLEIAAVRGTRCDALGLLRDLASQHRSVHLDLLATVGSSYRHLSEGRATEAMTEAESAHQMAREHNLIEAGLRLALLVAEAALAAGDAQKLLDYGTHLSEVGSRYRYPFIARRGRDLGSLGAVLTATGDRALDALQSLHGVLRKAQDSATPREQMWAHLLLHRALVHLGSGRDAEHHRREAFRHARECHADGLERSLRRD
jgi:serine/threonine protein kinase